MKKLLLLLSLVVGLALPAFAQTGPIVRAVPLSFAYGPLVSSAVSAPGSVWCTPDLSSYPYGSHQITYTFTNGAPGAVVITATGTTNGRTFSGVGSGTVTTGGTISITGVYAALCVTATTMTGAGVTVSGVYSGVSPIGSVTIDTTGLATGISQGATTSGQSQTLVACSVTTAAPTYTDGQSSPLNCTPAGLMRVSSSGFDNLIQVNGTTILAGAGNTGAGSLRVTIASDQAKIPVAYSDGTSLLSTDVANVASSTSPIMSMNSASANSGLNAAVAGACDDTSPTAITENSFGFARINCTTHALSTQPAPLIGQGGSLVSGAVTSAMTGTTSTSVVGAPGANTYNYITQCTTSNASTTVSTDILLQDGSGGTTLYVLPAPAASVATTGGGGGAFDFPVPLKVPTANNALFAANVTTGSSTKISCSGFKSLVSY